MISRVIVLLLVVGILLSPVTADAAPGDQAALKKIDTATQHFLSSDFDRAEKALRAILATCKNECSPDVLARVWMYIGLVQGAGFNNQAAARKSFDKALNLDPQVELDEELTTPDTTKTFRELKKGFADTADGAAPGAAPEQTALLLCTPDVQEVALRYAIPIACPMPLGSTSAKLYYTADPEADYTELPMKVEGRRAVATIPCSATDKVGAILLYVAAKDESGQDLARWGASDTPIIIQIVNATKSPPPSLPGKPPPPRCERKEGCEPGTPGCLKAGVGLKGDPCAMSDECSKGLYCASGACAPAPRCKSGAECPATGECVDGFCLMEKRPPPSEAGFELEEKPEAPPPPYYLNRFGLHVGFDLAMVSGTKICAREGWEDGFRCYNDADQTVRTNEEPQPDFSSDVSTTFVYSSTRLLLSYERVLRDRISGGVRAGIALGGAPKEFLPFHGELYGSYWFAPFEQKGLHPYASVGFGLAQVDAEVSVTNRPAGGTAGQDVNYVAYKRMGKQFLKLGGGLVYDLSASIGLQANLNALIMLPSTGFVIQPSVGAVIGF